MDLALVFMSSASGHILQPVAFSKATNVAGWLHLSDHLLDIHELLQVLRALTHKDFGPSLWDYNVERGTKEFSRLATTKVPPPHLPVTRKSNDRVFGLHASLVRHDE